MGKKNPHADILGSLLSTEDGRARHQRTAGLGFWHQSCYPYDPEPGSEVDVFAFVGADIDVTSVSLKYTTDGSNPTTSPSAVTVGMHRHEIVWNYALWCYTERYSGRIPGQNAGTTVRYCIQAVMPEQQTIFVPHLNVTDQMHSKLKQKLDDAQVYHTYRRGEPVVHRYDVDELQISHWLKDAVIYQVIPDRFKSHHHRDEQIEEANQEFHGGTLIGLMQELDYLSDLGVNCIWLTPIFPSPSHHGYDCTDFGTIEPRLGTEQDWQLLVQACRARQIRLILDFAANHVSSAHPAFQSALNDQHDRFRSWFRFTDWPHEYDCYAMVKNFPVLETENDSVREHLISQACKWLGSGCDGFRLDHAHGLSHGFWSEFRTLTRKVAPDSVMIGEVSYAPDRARTFAGRMDGILDFKLCELLRQFVLYQSIGPIEFDRQLRRHQDFFQGHLLNPSFFDNHDMDRLLWLAGGDKRKVKLAALLQLTITSPPIIYYGTEVGLSQRSGNGRLEEARLPYPDGDQIDSELLTFFRNLLAIRKANLPKWRSSRELILADDRRGIYVFSCGVQVVAINNSLAVQHLNLPEELNGIVLATECGAKLDANSLGLPPLSGVILDR